MKYGIAAEFTGGPTAAPELQDLARNWITEEARRQGATVTIDRVDVTDLEGEGAGAPRPLANAGGEVEWGEDATEIRRRLKAVADVPQQMDRGFAGGIAERARAALQTQANARDVRVSIYEL